MDYALTEWVFIGSVYFWVFILVVVNVMSVWGLCCDSVGVYWVCLLPGLLYLDLLSALHASFSFVFSAFSQVFKAVECVLSSESELFLSGRNTFCFALI